MASTESIVDGNDVAAVVRHSAASGGARAKPAGPDSLWRPRPCAWSATCPARLQRGYVPREMMEYWKPARPDSPLRGISRGHHFLNEKEKSAIEEMRPAMPNSTKNSLRPRSFTQFPEPETQETIVYCDGCHTVPARMETGRRRKNCCHRNRAPRRCGTSRISGTSEIFMCRRRPSRRVRGDHSGGDHLSRSHPAGPESKPWTATASVLLMGEDVGVYGGAFQATAGLLARFGWERVLDTPISEAGVVGAAAGMSYMGLRPVVEMTTIRRILCSSAFEADRQRAREIALSLGRTVAGGDPWAGGRRRARRPVSFHQPGGLFRAHSGTQGRVSGDRV